tara:strand:+ start:37 stop:678 length:642 start_codon:yes stop_codon:yes gene_type:complete
VNSTKEQFIQLIIQNKAIQFGQFKLKSGRLSPYFFNAGLIADGHGLLELGELFAQTLIESGIEFDGLFGPAYKGLPLATTTAIALAKHKHNVSVTFNRKEAKLHGEGGDLIGAPLTNKMVMIDDVITAGTAFRHAQQIIKQYEGQLKAVVIALDRCERGIGANRAIDEIKAEGINVLSIVTIFDVIQYLKENNKKEIAMSIQAYLDENGVAGV